MGSCWEAAFSLCLCFASILTTSSSYVFLQTSQRWRYILVTSLFPSHSGTEGQFKGLLTKVCVFELLTMDRSPRWKPTWAPANHAMWAKTRPQNLYQQLHFKAQDETNQMRYEAVLLKNRVGRLFLEVNGVNLTVRICAWPPLTLFFCCAANKWPTLWLENHRHGSVALHSYLQRNYILLSKAAGSQCDLHFTCLSICLYFKNIPRLLLHCSTAPLKSETAKIKNIYKNILLPW